MVNRKPGLWESDPFLLLCSTRNVGGETEDFWVVHKTCRIGNLWSEVQGWIFVLTNSPGHFYACGSGAMLWGTSLQELHATEFRTFVSSPAYKGQERLHGFRQAVGACGQHYTESPESSTNRILMKQGGRDGVAAEGFSPTPWPQSLSSGMADFVV